MDFFVTNYKTFFNKNIQQGKSTILRKNTLTQWLYIINDTTIILKNRYGTRYNNNNYYWE